MRPKFKALGLATVIIMLCLAFVTLIISSAQSSATVSARIIDSTAKLEVYSDSTCTQRLASINWGTIPQGSSANQTFYIKNLSSTKLTLKMSTTNWNPTIANGPIALTWNREKTILKPNEVISATFKIDVASNTTGFTNFSLDITITGTSVR